MRFVPLLFLALADCGSAAVTSPDTTVDPCPSAAATVAAGPTCGQAGGERFGRECATLRTVVPAQCLPAFDAHVRRR